VPFVFGCQLTESGLFRTQYADGIMGMTMDPYSIISAFHDNGSIRRKSFSMCLDRNDGILSLGGHLSENHHVGPMQFTNLIPGTSLYSVVVQSIYLNNEEIKNGVSGFNTGRGTIIDSGTTDTYLPKDLGYAFWKAWLRVTGMNYSNTRQEFTYSEFQTLPDITIVMQGGARWVLRPEYYFEPAEPFQSNLRTNPSQAKAATTKWTGKRGFTNRVYFDEPTGAILGSNSMMGHDIVFDVDLMRIGFATADCTLRADEL